MTLKDDEIERALRRYRPVGPSDALSAHIAAETRRARRGRLLAWLPAAAALAAMMLLHLLASRTYAEISGPAERAAREVRATELESLTAAFGGGDLGRAEAERVLAEVEESRAQVPLPDPSLSEGAPR